MGRLLSVLMGRLLGAQAASARGNRTVSQVWGSSQYAAVVIIPDVIHYTEPLSLIVTLCAVGIGAAFLLMRSRCHQDYATPTHCGISNAAICIVCAG